MIFGLTLYEVLWYFLIYSFIGWVAEVIFNTVVLGNILNRGFLNGPVCPIYGFGVISVFALAHYVGGGVAKLDQMPLLQLFFGGMVLATAVELIGGFILDVCFHARWWDYSDIPFYLHGYICLEFSILWGLAVAFVLRVIQPYIRAASVEFIPEQIGFPILVVCYAVYLLDVIVTVLMVNKLNRYLKELDTLQKKLRIVSNGLRDALGTSAYVTMNTLDKGKEKAEKVSKRIRDGAASAGNSVHSIHQGIGEAVDSGRERLVAGIRERYNAVMNSKYFGMGRLLHANPGMKHREYPELVEELQKDLNKSDK